MAGATPGAWTTIPAATIQKPITISGLTPTTIYGFQVQALGALGYSQAKIVEEKIDVAYSTPGSKKFLYALKRGQPAGTSFDALCKLVAQKEFDLHIHLHLGNASAIIYASDLTEEYVEFNKGDVSDPASLGG